IAAVEVHLLPAGQAAAGVAGFEPDQLVELHLQPTRLEGADLAGADGPVDAAVKVVFAMADGLPSAVVIAPGRRVARRAVRLGGGRNSDRSHGHGEGGDKRFLDHRFSPLLVRSPGVGLRWDQKTMPRLIPA